MRVFTNATFLSCEEKNTSFQVLVEDRGRIVFTGDTIPEKYIGAEKIDLEGKCVVPAFADTHIHFGSFALFNFGLDLRPAQSFEEMAAIINDYEQRRPREKFLFGMGPSPNIIQESRPIQRAELDQMTSRPLLIENYDGHSAVANSALIKLFPSAIRKDPDFNEQTGWLYVNSHYEGINYVSKMMNLFSLLSNMIEAADFMARKGISLIHSVEGNGFPGDRDFTLVQRIVRAFPQEFRLFLQSMDTSKAIKRRLPRIGGCFACALDGSFSAEDAALLEPYTHNPDNRGVLMYSQQQVNEFVKAANRAELQVEMHAVGDAAFDQAVTAYEEALKDYPRTDHRHTIIHGNLVNQELINRAARLDIHLAVQPNFLFWPEEPYEFMEKILGDRAWNNLPFKSYLDAGLTLGAGSDGPCTLPDPMLSIHNACHHFNPDQRISVDQALKMHTSWAARLSFDEKELGTLTPGKWAHLSVLSQNPLETPLDKLKDITVDSVYFQGKKYQGMSHSIAGLLFKSLTSFKQV
ncbi:MAG TPA: amidohydrolase [Syntrophomonadaceae bacterium]|nr:amidohydrolase [Syntrophomonadaceae bacterium]